ncbi:TPA: hypothetical protein ACG8NK_002804, partial [Enterococcus faecium]
LEKLTKQRDMKNFNNCVVLIIITELTLFTNIYYIHEAQSSLIEDWAIFMAKEGKEMFQNKG